MFTSLLILTQGKYQNTTYTINELNRNEEFTIPYYINCKLASKWTGIVVSVGLNGVSILQVGNGRRYGQSKVYHVERQVLE